MRKTTRTKRKTRARRRIRRKPSIRRRRTYEERQEEEAEEMYAHPGKAHIATTSLLWTSTKRTVVNQQSRIELLIWLSSLRHLMRAFH